MVRDSSSVADTRLPADSAAGPAAASTPDGDKDNGPRPKRRRRHWLRRIVITVVLFVLILAVAIQLVLWSNLPKRLVLEQLQSQLGLRVQASSLTTGWLGNTSLREVTLGLPMAEQSFLDMPRMRVKHTTLFGLLLRRPVSVDLIELDTPTLYVRRDQAGRWNVQEVTQLVARALGSKPADESAKQSRPKLPEVRLSDGTVVIQDYGKADQKIRPLNVHGRPDPATPGLLYRYDLEVPDHLKLVGQVAPGAPWSHEVTVAVGNLKDWVEPWSPGFPADAKLAARWTGRQTDGGVSGRLELQQATAAGSGATGVVLVSTQGSTVTVRPDGLTVATQNKMLDGAKVASGAIVYDGTTARTDRLIVAALGGQARIDAEYALASRSGQLRAEWIEVTTGAVRHSGTLDAKVGSTFRNRPQLEATLVSHGVSPDGPWAATVQVNGTSAGGWADMDYDVTGKQLDWRGSHPIALDGMTAKLETRVDDKTHERVIRLARLNSPGNRVESVGEYNLTNRHWKFWISLNALPMPGEVSGTASVGVPPRKENAATRPAAAPPEAQAKQDGKQNAAQVAVLLNSWGDSDHLEIGQLVVRGAELEITSAGNYFYARPSPLDLNVKVRHIPPRVAERDRPPLYGYLSGEASIRGTVLEPRDLKIEGKLLGEGVTLYQRSLGDFNVKVGGHVDGMHAMLRSEKLELLKGQWSFDALYTQQSGAVTMNLRVADLDLREVGDLLVRFDPNWTGPVRQTKQDVDLLGGHVSAEWNIEVPRTDKDRLRVTGGVRAKDVRAPGFSADLVDAKTLLERGTVTLGPIHVVRGITRTVDGQQSRVEGTADASVSADLDDLTQVTVALNLVNWPIETGAEGWADVSGGTEKLVIDLSSEPDAKQKFLPGKSATGTIEFASALTYQGKTLGRARIIGDCLGRMIDLRKFDIQTLDGNVVGNGVIELEKPLEARAFFTWERVNSQRLVGLFPALKGLQGVYAGRLRVQPAVDPRALGPLAISLELDPENGRYDMVQIGPTVILAYADYNRLVLNDPADLASTIRIAAGTLKLWGRISYHDLQTTKDAISSQLLVQFEGLDLNQVIHAAHPQAEETPGRLDGSLTILAASRGPRVHPRAPGVPPAPFSEKLATALVVHGPIKLSEAKLGVIPVFSGMYDVMHAGQDVKASNGVGSVDVRMENGNLELNNLRYFNRGTEVRGMFTIEQVWKLPDSPLHGTAIGSLRPLASVSLPFFAEADRIIALLSSDLASIGVDGTVKNQHTYQIGLRDLGTGLRTLLLGEVPQERPENRAGPKTGATRMEQSP